MYWPISRYARHYLTDGKCTHRNPLPSGNYGKEEGSGVPTDPHGSILGKNGRPIGSPYCRDREPSSIPSRSRHRTQVEVATNSPTMMVLAFLLLSLLSSLFGAEAFISRTSFSSRGINELKMSAPEIEVVSNPSKEFLDEKGGKCRLRSSPNRSCACGGSTCNRVRCWA